MDTPNHLEITYPRPTQPRVLLRPFANMRTGKISFPIATCLSCLALAATFGVCIFSFNQELFEPQMVDVADRGLFDVGRVPPEWEEQDQPTGWLFGAVISAILTVLGIGWLLYCLVDGWREAKEFWTGAFGPVENAVRVTGAARRPAEDASDALHELADSPAWNSVYLAAARAQFDPLSEARQILSAAEVLGRLEEGLGDEPTADVGAAGTQLWESNKAALDAGLAALQERSERVEQFAESVAKTEKWIEDVERITDSGTNSLAAEVWASLPGHRAAGQRLDSLDRHVNDVKQILRDELALIESSATELGTTSAQTPTPQSTR